MPAKTIKLGEEEYSVIDPAAVQASKILVDSWIKLGKPTDPFSPSGKKIVNLIIAIWEDCFPIQRELWYGERKKYQESEMSIGEQVRKGTGRSLASFPVPVYHMLTKTFKGFDPAERKNCIKMVKEWPLFRFANRI